MSEDEAPSSPDSDILFSNAFEDIDEDSVKIHFDLLRQPSDEFDIAQPPSKRARKKSNKDRNETTPIKDSSPNVVENVNDVNSGAVSDTVVIPDSPESFTIPDSPENFSFPRRGRQTTRQRRVSQPRKTRSSMRAALLNNSSAPDAILIDDLSSPSPVKRNCDSVFNESLSILADDEALEESEPSSAPNDSINCEVTVRVIWKGGHIHHFSLRKFQKLKEIFTSFAKKESVPEDRIMLVVGDRRLTPDDSPHSIGTLSFIEGGIIDYEDSKSTAIHQTSAPVDANSLELKVQQKGVKEKLKVYISRTDKMAIFMSKVAEELDIPLGQMKFMFDGEALDPNETPVTLDLDGGECIELTVKQ